jgi:hypothetical protein
MSTPIADMVERMASAGIPPEFIALAVRTAEEHAQAVAGEDKAAARRRAYDRERKRRKSSGISADDKSSKEIPPTPPKEKLPPSDFSREKSSEARAVYSDSRHELFGEGVPILITFGRSDRQARSLIGSWLKQAGDDAQQVLGAIQRARDHRPHEPIAWITQAIRPNGRSHVSASSRDRHRSGGFAIAGLEFSFAPDGDPDYGLDEAAV